MGTVALVTFDTVGRALRAPLAPDTRTSVEGRIVTPLLLGRQPAIDAVAVFVTVRLRGIAGAFLAVPVPVIVKVRAGNLPPLAAFGRFLDAPRPVGPGGSRGRGAACPPRAFGPPPGSIWPR